MNEPRIREEFGAKWNEKWIYRGADGKSVARVVLWLRYDLTGIFRIAADGSAESEAPPGASCEAPPEASFEALAGA